MSIEKPIKAKPHFYACCLLPLQTIARDLGYNLILRGSADRDMDLVAIPWIDEPKTHLELLQSFNRYLNGVEGSAIINDLLVSYDGELEEKILANYYCFSTLPGGRSSYIINLNRGGKYNHYVDEQYYLDISITPLVKQPISSKDCKHLNVKRDDGLDECLDCGTRNY